MLNSKKKVFFLSLIILYFAFTAHFLIFKKFENRNNNLLKANLVDLGIVASDDDIDNSSESNLFKPLKIQSFESYKKAPIFFKPEIKKEVTKKEVSKTTSIKEDKDNPILSAHSILLRDISSNNVLMKKNESVEWPMASLTKLMTATIAIENMDLSSKITISEKSANQSSNSLFKAGESYSALDMIKASLILSNNASAMALSESFGYQRFMGLMQSKADFLGMKKTKFYEPTGLSPLNKSTALDFEILAKYIYTNHKEILDITSEKIAEIKELSSGNTKTLNSTNIFAGEEYFIGGKTGYTAEAQGNLFSIFKAGNKVLLSIVLGSTSRFEDTQKIYILGLRKLLGLSVSK